MSLLDDVSIVVTPNGYKVGELYAVIPVPSEGAEEVVNGDFATETVWTFTNVDFSVGAVLFDNANDNIFQNFSDTINTIYKLTITKTGSGTLRVRTGFAGSAATKIDIPESGIVYFTSTSDTNRIQIYGDSGNVNATLNSVSVKEWTGADMDVTRATAGTRVDENGLVNYAEVIGSELVTCGDFSCAAPTNYWTATNAVISFANNQLTVDDTAGAGGDSRGSQVITTESGKTYRLTFNRISTTSLFYVGVGGGTSYNNIFYSSLGTDTGEYTLEFTATSSSSIIAFISGGNGITVFSNISVKEVTRDNVPRIDYTGGGCPHILAEPQRTNNLTASQDLTYSFWNSINTETIVASTVLSPDGTTFGFKAIPSTSTSSHYVDYDWGFLSMPIGEVTYSIFVKPFGYTNFQLASSSGMLSRYQNFELTGDGVLGSGDVNGAKIEKIGDWYRCTITETSVSASPRVLNIATPSSGLGRNPSFTGNGTDGVLLWGAQIEEGTYPTSYIPNLSTTSGSTVTRNQDIFTRDGIGSLINSTEGVLFAEVSALVEVDTARRFITLNDGGASNNVVLRYEATGVITARYQVGGVAQCSIAFATTITNSHKIAFKYKVNDFALWIDGTEVGTDTSGSVLGADTINKISFDSGNGSFPFYGKVKQLQVYTTALTDAQLTSLTT